MYKTFGMAKLLKLGEINFHLLAIAVLLFKSAKVVVRLSWKYANKIQCSESLLTLSHRLS